MTRWSWTWMPPWSRPIRTGNRRRRCSRRASVSIRPGRSSTTARTVPGNRLRCCCAPATPGRTRLPTTSRSPPPRSASCPDGCAGPVRCSSARDAGGTHAFVEWLHRRRVGHSVGFALPDNAGELIARLPKAAWTPAYDADRRPRHGAFVAELTGLTNLPPHDFHAEPDLVRPRRARLDLTAWTQLLALPDQPARRWEPKRLRHRLFSLVRHARQTVLHLAAPGRHSPSRRSTQYAPCPPPDTPKPPTSHPADQEKHRSGRGPDVYPARQRGTRHGHTQPDRRNLTSTRVGGQPTITPDRSVKDLG